MCLAIPAKIISIEGSSAVVDFGGIGRKVSLGITEGVKKGDHVLVHAGFVIGKVSPEEAVSTKTALAELKKTISEGSRGR